MNLQPSPRTRRESSRPDRGFTLVEVTISLVLSAVIVGVIVAALFTSQNVARSATSQINASSDTGLISSFLFRDAQSAGGIDPTTGNPSTLGVSTTGDTGGWNCGATPSGTTKVRFSWIEYTSPQSSMVVLYVYDSVAEDLTRQVCNLTTGVRGATVLLSSNLGSVTAACVPVTNPLCTRPTSVVLTVGGSGAQASFSSTLTASVRTAASQLTISKPDVFPAGGQVGVAYTTLVTSAGSTGTSVWSTAGLPPGLTTTSSPSGLAVSGSPTSAGNFTPIITVTDAVTSVSRTYPVTIGQAALAISGPATLPGGQKSIVYTNTTMNAVGGTGPYTWSVLSGALPTSLTMSPSTGLISGTPSVAGPYSPVIKVTDSLGATATASYTVVINASPVVSLPLSMPAGEVAIGYPTQTMTVTGGTSPYTWSVSAGALPTGVTMTSGGVITGTPSAATTYTPTIKVTDSFGATSTKAYSIVIKAVPVISAPATLPNGQKGVVYTSTTMTVTGGTSAYTWSVLSGALPTGLTMNASTGLISGTPTVAGSYSPTIKVTDSFGASDTKAYSLTISPAALVVTLPAALPSGQVSVAYTSTTMTATGGTTPYTWTATGLPTGLVISTAGVISGTPTASGTFASVVVTVTDAASVVATKGYSVAITAQLVISAPATLPSGRVGTVYTSTTMTRTGGTSPYTWTVVSGMPAGLSMSTAGVLTGTPTAAGTFSSVIVKVADAVTNVTRTYAIVVAKKTYYDTINDTVGLVNYWRLGEASATSSSDTFTGDAGSTLQSHVSDSGAAWAKPVGTWADAVITGSTGRIRKGGTNTGVALYYTSAAPASVDYKVEADLHVPAVPLPTNDAIGVVGRLDPAASPSGTYYQAFYEYSSQKWTLAERTSSGFQWIGQSNVASLSVGTYRLTLDMSGSTIRLLVNGVEQVSVVDTSITAAGRAGVILGWNNQGTTDTDTSGMQLDNFSVTGTTPVLADNEAVNNGSYLNGPTLGVAGALVGDTNTAVAFDGVNEYGAVARQISDNFSIEFWFKSTQGIGTGTAWTSGAGLVDASIPAVGNDFGVSLRSDGKLLAGVGGASDTTLVSSAGGYDNGAWHHVVFTRTMSTGALVLYVDGVSKATGTGSKVSLTAAANINFARIQSGGNFFAGSMDEIAMYNVVLTSAIVNAHYSAAS